MAKKNRTDLPKLIAVLGPTATGKSDFAVMLAKKIGGEIISADSRQVYTGLDIGSGKITKAEMQGIPHHLLDVANPKKIFSVAEYKSLAEKAIADILVRGNVPILCGGTGFYIDAVANGITHPEVPPNNELRKKLDMRSTAALFTALKKLDPKRAETIDRHNKVRLIRAIEIAKALGEVPLLVKEEKYDVLFLGLDAPDAVLKEKTQKRLLSRIEDGMLQEVKRLHENGVSWKRLETLGLEYRACAQFLQKKIDKESFIEGLRNDIWHYAKRQRTWFKKNKNIVWLDVTKKTSEKEALKLTREFLK